MIHDELTLDKAIRDCSIKIHRVLGNLCFSERIEAAEALGRLENLLHDERTVQIKVQDGQVKDIFVPVGTMIIIHEQKRDKLRISSPITGFAQDLRENNDDLAGGLHDLLYWHEFGKPRNKGDEIGIIKVRINAALDRHKLLAGWDEVPPEGRV